MKEIKIPLSKKKLVLLWFGAVGFTFFSIWFILKPSDFVNSFTRNETIVFIGGIIGLIIFGPASVVLFFKLFDKKPGLIIDEKGITDNSNTSSIGLIKWSEITRISQTERNSIKFLVVELENPKDFFEKLSPWKKLSSRQNLKNHGTPITLSTVGLQCSFDELEKRIMENYKKFRKNNKSPYETRNENRRR